MINLNKYPYVGYDTETTGLVYPRDKAFSFAIATPDGQVEAYDLRRDMGGHPEEARIMARQLMDYQGTIICHYASFDYRMSHAAGVKLRLENMDCTSVRASLLDEHRNSYSLDDLCWDCLHERKAGDDMYKEMAKRFGGPATRKAQIGSLWRAPWNIIEPYVKHDSWLALRLWMWQEGEIERQDKYFPTKSVRDIVDFERGLMPHFIAMEMHGIRVDEEAAHRAVDDMNLEVNGNFAALRELIGRDININSSAQVRDVFKPVFDDDVGSWQIGNTYIGATGKGQPSLAADQLRALAAAGDRRAELIHKTRSLIKTRDTFLQGHILGHMVGDRVYPHINQVKGEDGGTGTGRLSYTGPALQQIPSRDKATAAIVKPIFLPDEGHEWFDVDANSFEVRIFAHLVARFDPRIIKTYKDNPNTDFHQWVADETGLPRTASYNGQPNAKQLNLSMIFNAGSGNTAMQMGLPYTWDEFEGDDGSLVRYAVGGDEVMEVINKYHDQFPGVRQLQQRAREVARERGFVHTHQGRRIRFPRGWYAYKASGLLIQATAADYNKENVSIIRNGLARFGGNLLLNTHDSYSMSLPKGEARYIWAEIQPLLEERGRANVPLIMDVNGLGANWWGALTDAHGFKASQ